MTTLKTPTPPRGPLAGHESHDPMLVSSLAAGDLAGTERERAEAQVAACTDCAELAADIRLLAAATRAVPTPPRPRDFSLSPADAARLRPTGLRALVAAIAAPRSLARPLSATLTTLGVAGLLLAALPQVDVTTLGAAGSAYLVPVDGALGAQSTPMPEVGVRQGPAGPGGPAGPDATSGHPPDGNRLGGNGDDVGALVVVSGSLLIAGLGLYGIRWSGRRFH